MTPPSDLIAVIMAGGAGTRFWPMSTEARPKQFLTLFGDRSLIQRSHDRLRGLVPPERVLVLTHAAYVDLVREQLPEIPPDNVVGEPLRRDTAAAVALAALLARHRFQTGVMAVLTADHLIDPKETFQQSMRSAAAQASTSGALYTFGIPPTYPATAYGYLEKGRPLSEVEGGAHFELKRFVEKPDRQTAENYLSSGQFLWNSGMFVWTLDAILAEFARQLPQHLEKLEPVLASDRQSGFGEALRRAFEGLKPVSVDFGIMENARQIRCVAAPFDWNDVGGWLALEEHLNTDDAGNSARGRIAVHEAANNLVFCENADEQVALVGVSGMVIVRSGETTLVMDRDHAEALKELVKKQKQR